MLLYANGCSMTAGDELELESDIDFSNNYNGLLEYQKEHAWPQKLADMYNWDVYNDAECGGSNDRILRTTIDYISSLDSTNELFVIIGWTSLPRYDLYLNENNEHIKNNYTPLLLTYPNPYEPITKELGELLFTHSYDDQTMYNHYFKTVLMMQLFLKSKNIPYLMFNAASNNNKTEVDENILNQIDSTAFLFNEPRKLSDYCMSDKIYVKGFKRHPRLHPCSDGHLYWASLIKDEIKIK